MFRQEGTHIMLINILLIYYSFQLSFTEVYRFYPTIVKPNVEIINTLS